VFNKIIPVEILCLAETVTSMIRCYVVVA